MNKRISIMVTVAMALVAALLLSASHAAAADPQLPKLFPRKAEVKVPAGSGMTQLQLPPAIQSAVKPDLRDVRLIDAGGNEVPYLLDTSARPWRKRHDSTIERYASTRRVARRKRRRDGQRQYHEEYAVDRPTPHRGVSAWTLHLDSTQRRFVARIRIVDDERPERTLAGGSLYRLRDPLREGLRIPLPRELPETLRIIIDTEDGYLSPTAHFRGRQPHELAKAGVPLKIIEQSSEHGFTTLVIERARGVVPLAIDISTATPTFHRPIRVSDSGPGGGDQLLGSAAIYRVADLDGVAQTRIPLRFPSGDKLTLRIKDDDSPPLSEVKVSAIVEPPTLLFDASGPLTLLYGGGRAHLPRYDVAELPAQTSLDDWDWREAELGVSEDNEAFDPSPALSFLLRAGAGVDREAFTHRRPLTIKGAREGISQLRLSAADIAASRNALHDLRIVDEEGRQWPYLLEQQQVKLQLDSEISEPRPRTTGTHYLIKLPAQPLAITQLELKSDAPLIRRSYKLYGKHDGRQEMLASGMLSRSPGDSAPLTIDIHASPQDELDLVVTDGGDAPLTFSAATVSVPSADVYVAAPDGAYWMLLGNAEAQAPDYELSQARELALALPAPKITAGPIEGNPAHKPKVEDPAPTRMMWGALVLAVLILGGLTFRAARERSPEDEPQTQPDKPQTATAHDEEAADASAQEQDEHPRDEDPEPTSA